MPNYPNDPGPDHQGHHGHHHPREEMTLITTEVLLEGIALQTKYAYKCSEDFFNRSTKYADGVGATLTSRLSEISYEVKEELEQHRDAIAALNNKDKEVDISFGAAKADLNVVQSMLNNRLSGKDHCYLASLIYGM